MRKIYVSFRHDWNWVHRLESEGYQLFVQLTGNDIKVLFDSDYDYKVKYHRFYDFGDALVKLFYNYKFSKYRCILEMGERRNIKKFFCVGQKRDWKKLLN